jgi:hypothetical protein
VAVEAADCFTFSASWVPLTGREIRLRKTLRPSGAAQIELGKLRYAYLQERWRA